MVGAANLRGRIVAVTAVRDAICQSYNGDAFQRVIYSESHHEVANGKSRVLSEIAPGEARSWYAKKELRWRRHWSSRRPAFRCFFKGESFYRMGGFKILSPLTGTCVKFTMGFWTCIAI